MKKIFLYIGILATIPSCAFAWGKQGHYMVAEIAFSLLDSNTRQMTLKYLAGTSIEDASIWMDEVRSNHSYDYMKPWHYVNIEKGSTYSANGEKSIVTELGRVINELKHRNGMSNDAIREDLMILFHLAGDLHMPLHTGYASDKGGNDCHVTFAGNPTNLHRVWDSEIIEHEHITTINCLALYDHYNKSETDHLKQIDIQTWIAEPRSLLDDVYSFSNGNIDQAYIDKNKPVVEQQLLIAGIRLAGALEYIFKS